MTPDAIPIPSRLAAFSALRGLFAAAVVSAALAVPSVGQVPRALLVGVSVVYVALAATLEVFRRHRGRIHRTLLNCALLADAAYLVAAATVTGGPQGPLGFVLLAHIIAATLLASYRTGLKLVVWDSLLLAVAYSLQSAGLPGVPASTQQAAVTAVTGFCCIALVTAACSALNERELRHGRAGYAALAAMAADVQRTEEPDDIVPVLLETVTRSAGYPRAAVVLCSPNDEELACWVTGGQDTAPDHWTARAAEPASARGSLRADAAARMSLEGAAPVLRRTLEARDDRVLAQALPDARNVVVVPLLLNQDPMGVLAVERGGRRHARMPASMVTLLAQFATHASLAYGNAALRGQLGKLAALDGLTHLANRRMFDETLEREVQRARRERQSLAVLMMDVDHFKDVNDRHGHLVGDEVLRQVAGILESRVRGSDLGARYGGEEFAVLLPACDTAGAWRVAEELRAAVAASTEPVQVTVSVGVAALPQDADTPTELLKVADAALYAAKAAGRDRVVCATGVDDAGGDG